MSSNLKRVYESLGGVSPRDRIPTELSPLEDWIVDLEEREVDMLVELLKVFQVFRDRDAVYQGLWKQLGYVDNVFHVRHKAMRLFRVIVDQGQDWDENTEDSAQDIVNYALFALRCAREGRRSG